MNESEKSEIDELARRAFADLADAVRRPSEPPMAEYRLPLKKAGTIDRGRNPPIFQFVAAAMFLFLVLPPFLWRDETRLSEFATAAYERGSLERCSERLREIIAGSETNGDTETR